MIPFMIIFISAGVGLCTAFDIIILGLRHASWLELEGDGTRSLIMLLQVTLAFPFAMMF
jgi:hypothetical protein